MYRVTRPESSATPLRLPTQRLQECAVETLTVSTPNDVTVKLVSSAE